MCKYDSHTSFYHVDANDRLILSIVICKEEFRYYYNCLFNCSFPSASGDIRFFFCRNYDTHLVSRERQVIIFCKRGGKLCVVVPDDLVTMAADKELLFGTSLFEVMRTKRMFILILGSFFKCSSELNHLAVRSE
ncbi:hypothetical protein BDC45DRAFT_540114 [Circinella umbellata]|nr:hypothetical protein BDC45DRAFT_540114 [Circinella umbellata]